eukprot:8115247-Alexandrium_andersonii.AAC.1
MEPNALGKKLAHQRRVVLGPLRPLAPALSANDDLMGHFALAAHAPKKIQDMDRRPRQPSCLAHGQEAYLAKEASPALVEDHHAHQVALEVLHHLGLIPRARALRVLPHEEAAEGVAELGHLDVEAQEVPRCKEALPGDQR